MLRMKAFFCRERIVDRNKPTENSVVFPSTVRARGEQLSRRAWIEECPGEVVRRRASLGGLSGLRLAPDQLLQGETPRVSVSSYDLASSNSVCTEQIFHGNRIDMA